MTVQKTTSKSVYKGDGVTTIFPITFELGKDDYVHVYVRKGVDAITETKNFTINNKNVIYPASGEALADGDTLVITRELLFLQQMNLVNQGPFFAENIEQAFDEVTMMIQQLDEKVNRAVTVEIDTSDDPNNIVERIYNARSEAEASAQRSEAAAQKAYDDGKDLIEQDVLAAQNAANVATTIGNKFSNLDSVDAKCTQTMQMITDTDIDNKLATVTSKTNEAVSNANLAEQKASDAAASAAQAAASASAADTSRNEAKGYRDAAAAIVTPDGLAAIVAKNIDNINALSGAVSPALSLYVGKDVMNIPGSIRTNGLVDNTNADNMAYSAFIKCNVGDTLRYKLSGYGSRLLVAVYNEKQRFLNGVASAGGNVFVEGTYTFAEGDSYFRIGGMNMNNINYPSYYVDYNTLPSKIVDLENKLTENLDVHIGEYKADINRVNRTANELKLTSPLTIVDLKNQRIRSNGTLDGQTVGAFVSDIYRCVEGDSVSYILSCETNCLRFVVYDKNGNVTHTDIGNGYNNIPTIATTYTFTENDYTFRFSGVENNVDKYYLKYNNGIKTINALNTKIDSNIADVEYLKNLYNVLPNYWREYLPNKLETIKSNLRRIGTHGDNFIFITDVHVPRNSLYSPAIIKEIIRNTTIRKVFNGGDTLDEDLSPTEATNRLFLWRSLMDGVEEYCVMGNHDNNNYNGQNYENAISVDDYYSAMVKQSESCIDTNAKPYYVVDNKSQKIRYICVNNGNYNAYTDAQQVAWFKQRLTELDNSWSILVIQHYIWGGSLDTYSANAEVFINAVNSVYNSMSAKFIGFLAGHAHIDHSAVESTYNYLLIATNCDTRSGSSSGYSRTEGTTNEHSFDVVSIDTQNRKIYMTRIGAGQDREFTY